MKTPLPKLCEAALQSPMPDGRVHCLLCAHGCHISPGKTGLCGVRRNQEGRLCSLVGDNIVSAHVDPVEKKPLYHYRPNTNTFSVGTMGCNFACTFCQNADISLHPANTGEVHGQRVTPEALVQAARHSGCQSLSFTYNEPTVFFELMLATAQKAGQAGLDCLLVSNGFQSQPCLEALGPHIRAANIDLKAFSNTFYQQQCRASLAPVLHNLRTMRDLGWWLEITTLLIPGLNDNPHEITALTQFIVNELGPHTPWHVSAFHPCYKMMDRPRTPDSTLTMACEIGLAEGLSFVYPGNTALSLPTRCPGCGQVFVERSGRCTQTTAKNGHCAHCKTRVAGIWD